MSVTEDGISAVKFIFDSYLSGKNSREISEKLNSQQALNRTWTSKTVDYVLQNERYAGQCAAAKTIYDRQLSTSKKTKSR